MGQLQDVATRPLGFRREATRARLLAACAELIGRQDGLNARIEEICAVAKTSRGTFYNYFSSLAELHQALWEQLADEQATRIQAATRTMDSSAARVDAAIRCYIDRARRDQAWGWAMSNLMMAGLVSGTDAFAHLASSISRGIASGEFSIADVRAGRDMVVGACLAAMITQLREPVDANYSATVSGLVLRSLK